MKYEIEIIKKELPCHNFFYSVLGLLRIKIKVNENMKF